MQDFYCTIYLLDNAIMYTCLVPNVIMPHPKKKQNAILNNTVQVIVLYLRIQIKKLCIKFLNDVICKVRDAEMTKSKPSLYDGHSLLSLVEIGLTNLLKNAR